MCFVKYLLKIAAQLDLIFFCKVALAKKVQSVHPKRQLDPLPIPSYSLFPLVWLEP